MTGEIVRPAFKTKARPPAEPAKLEPHVEVIETLGALLQHAKEGNVQGFAMVFADADGGVKNVIEASEKFDGQAIIGSLVVLTHYLAAPLND